MSNMIFTTDLVFGLIPEDTRLIAIYRQQDQRVRLIAQTKTSSSILVNRVTNEWVLFDPEQFKDWMQSIDAGTIKMLLPKKNVF